MGEKGKGEGRERKGRKGERIGWIGEVRERKGGEDLAYSRHLGPRKTYGRPCLAA